jgi:hypothetical protein
MQRSIHSRILHIMLETLNHPSTRQKCSLALRVTALREQHSIVRMRTFDLYLVLWMS